MKRFLIYILPLFIISLVFTSCEKEIDIDLPKVEPKLVIEGYIEQDQTAYVIISKSAPYFDPIDFNTLMNSIVRNATVIVSDGVQSEQLKDTISSTYPFFYYTGKTLKGVIGKTYYLRVEHEGKVYTAQTTLTPKVDFDSIWFQRRANSDSIGDIFAIGTDNGAEYNYYRVFTKIVGHDYTWVPIFGSVWDDKYFNGLTFTVQLYHGFASNIFIPGEEIDKSRGLGYKIGDTVITRLCTMDYRSYKFWSAAESEIFSGSNPFSSTTSIPTNIEGGAIGCWTGLTASYDTIICKTP